MTISFLVDSAEEAAFRAQVRDWLAGNLPDELKGWSLRPPYELIRPWHKKIYDRGWIAPHWPKEYGGMEATLNQELILLEEFAHAGAPELSRQALNLIGPILMRHGTEEQKARHLPPMLPGDVMWCQGYSEPGSGSDLASLTTRAAIDGGELKVNGQKIWTTWAHNAQWMYALVRTDPDAPKKQMGISLILIDLKTPGITIRPIRTLADDEEFAEVFFDDVRVPLENLVGELNDGWRVAKAVLSSERVGAGSPQLAYDGLERVRKVAQATGAMDDPAFRDRLARTEIEVVTLAAVFAQAVATVNAGEGLGPGSSFIKIAASRAKQTVADLLMEAAGELGPGIDRIETADGPVDVSTYFRQSRRLSIMGGTDEIQHNVIAKRVLDLPS